MSDWRIDELAQRAGVAVDTIRYYQREGLLPAGERAGAPLRFGARHLERLERIRALQSRRFSLAAIRALLDHDDGALAGSAGRLGGSRPTTTTQLVDAAGVSADLVRELTDAGLLRDPARARPRPPTTPTTSTCCAASPISASSAFPDAVLVELARIFDAGLDRDPAPARAAVFTADDGPRLGRRPRVECFESTFADQVDRVRARHPRRSPTTCSTATCSAPCSRRSSEHRHRAGAILRP